MAKPKKSKVINLLKLDFGCGEVTPPGWTGVDLYAPSASIKCDLMKFPLPWKDNTVDEIRASHFVEHIPREKRWQFFNEVWRILKLDAKFHIFVPNWKSERAYGDMTHEWPPFTTMALLYLGKQWRKDNKLEHGPYAEIKCNFDFQAGANGIAQGFADKHQEAQMFAITHYMEAYQDMWAVLVKKA